MREVMHPPAPDLPDVGVYKPPLFMPAQIPRTPFTEQRPEERQIDYQLPLQVDINKRLLKLFGNEYTQAVALRALRERGRALSDTMNSIPPEKINEGLDLDSLSNVGDKTACIRITAGLLASKYRINLHDHIERKLMERMQVKYPPDMVTEVRFHGMPENPGRKTGPETQAALKSSFDEETKTQKYIFRGLPIPREEEEARTPRLRFSGYFQDLAAWWQVRALGSDLVPSERIGILTGEKGEIEEVIAEFSGKSNEEINNLSDNNIDDLKALESIGDELGDVFIASYCMDASLGIDSDKKDQERMDIALKKYGNLPRYRKSGYSVLKIIDRLDEVYKRSLGGFRTPPPLAMQTVRSRN